MKYTFAILFAIFLMGMCGASDEFKGRMILRSLQCLGEDVDLSETFLANNVDCLKNRVQRLTKTKRQAPETPATEPAANATEPAASTTEPTASATEAAANAPAGSAGPIRKGVTCEIACTLQTNDLLDADGKPSDLKYAALMDSAFGSKKLKKHRIGKKLVIAEKDCREELGQGGADDELCTNLKPYISCLEKSFLDLCMVKKHVIVKHRKLGGGGGGLLNLGLGGGSGGGLLNLNLG